jgi:predicted transcriptional regulator of viral defense system
MLSTDYSTDYKAVLLKQDRQIFSIDDLAILWQIVNRNTLRTTIKRYLANQTLFSIRRGLYSVVPLKKLDPKLLGTSYISGFCYVSLQTVLAQEGLINQQPRAITLIGSRSQTFTLAGYDFICKKMKPLFLHNLEGINLDEEYPQATPARAVADMWYYNSRFYLDHAQKHLINQAKAIRKKVYT